jgi:LPS O-antigen subunit length determinant protein (WzzB/FepE family)
MRNNINLVDPDMDLVGILTTIWEGKIKIILILFFSVLVSYVYYSKQPKLFNTSIVIKQIQYKELAKFYSINELINEFHKSTKVITQDQNTKSYLESITSLERFVSEVMDYEELISIFEKNETVKKEITKLSKKDQQKMLYDYATSLTIKKKDLKKSPEYTLNFVWHDPAEAKQILKKVLELSKNNLENSFFNDLENLQKVRKSQIISKDLRQIEYLKEQSEISKALNKRKINNGEDLVERDLFIKEIISFLNFNIYDNKTLTFLKGSIAIDAEINIIKNRKYAYLEKFEKEIDNLKEIDLNWVDYNVFLMKSNPLGNTLLKNLILPTLISLIIAVLFVLLSNEFKHQKNFLKKKKVHS